MFPRQFGLFEWVKEHFSHNALLGSILFWNHILLYVYFHILFMEAELGSWLWRETGHCSWGERLTLKKNEARRRPTLGQLLSWHVFTTSISLEGLQRVCVLWVLRDPLRSCPAAWRHRGLVSLVAVLHLVCWIISFVPCVLLLILVFFVPWLSPK